jgi:hypothetical protein
LGDSRRTQLNGRTCSATTAWSQLGVSRTRGANRARYRFSEKLPRAPFSAGAHGFLGAQILDTSDVVAAVVARAKIVGAVIRGVLYVVLVLVGVLLGVLLRILLRVVRCVLLGVLSGVLLAEALPA